MKIKIKDNVYEQFCKEQIEKYGRIVNWEWAEILGQIEGQILEVDTEYLFKDQYNTKPIPGVSANGLRIMDEDVEYVIDDERPGKARCNWCGKVTKDTTKCEHCGKDEYLEVF